MLNMQLGIQVHILNQNLHIRLLHIQVRYTYVKIALKFRENKTLKILQYYIDIFWNKA